MSTRKFSRVQGFITGFSVAFRHAPFRLAATTSLLLHSMIKHSGTEPPTTSTTRRTNVRTTIATCPPPNISPCN